MTNWERVVFWMGSESSLILVIGIFVKCTAIATAGLLLAKIASDRRPDLRNLILRQTVALAVILPVLVPVSLFLGFPHHFANTPSLSLLLPNVAAKAMTTGTDTSESIRVWSVQGALVFLLILGSVLGFVRIGCGLYALRLIRIRTRPDFNRAPKEIDTSLWRAKHPGSSEVFFSDSVRSPFVLGFYHQCIVLPEISRTWKPQALTMVLQHELEHIRRLDNMWTLVGSIAIALNWFNPLVWIARRKMILEAERCCDGAVLEHSEDVAEYAGLLISLARMARFRATNPVLGTQILGMKMLEVRLMSILRTQLHSFRVSRRVQLAAFACTLMMLLPLVLVQFALADRPANGDGQTQVNKDNPSPGDFVDVTKRPEVLTSATPVYPDSARKAGIEGGVWVQALIDTTGSVAQARVMKSSGHKILDDAAVEAAKKSTYRPAESDGRRVRIWVTYEIKFKLKDKTGP